MRRSRLLPVFLAIAGLLAASSAAHAQRGGGGRGGFGGGYGYHGGYGYGRGFYGPGFGYGLGLGLGLGLYPYYYGAGPYWYNPIVVTPGYVYTPPPTVIVQGGQPGIDGQTPPPPPAQASPGEQPPKNAQIKVLLPDANAKVWFDGNPTTSTGSERVYHTPDLNPNANNSYRIRAQWTENGKQVVQEVVVPVQPGRGSVADFTRPPSEKIPAPPPPK